MTAETVVTVTTTGLVNLDDVIDKMICCHPLRLAS